MRQNSPHYEAEFTIAKRTVQLSVNPVQTPSAGKILILNDVTDHKLAEYALRTAEKLAATGKLANAIAHEINNPLEALTNLLYLAGTSGSLETTREFLSSANRELDRIARITKQALAFHRDTQTAIPIDLGELVADVAAMLERSAATRRIHLVCKRETSVIVNGFAGQLSQVFSNLIRNAAEAAPPIRKSPFASSRFIEPAAKASASRCIIAARGYPKISEGTCSIHFLRPRVSKAPAWDSGCRER